MIFTNCSSGVLRSYDDELRIVFSTEFENKNIELSFDNARVTLDRVEAKKVLDVIDLQRGKIGLTSNGGLVKLNIEDSNVGEPYRKGFNITLEFFGKFKSGFFTNQELSKLLD